MRRSSSSTNSLDGLEQSGDALKLMTAYSGYGNSIRLRSADQLVVYHAENGKVVIIEYEVHGKVLRTGAPYDNRFVSIITVADRKIVHWRDYMDSLAG
jgi:uncharacterized protein